MRTGSSDDKIAQCFRQFHNGQARIFRFGGFARDDDCAGFHGGYVQTGRLILALDKAHQFDLIDIAVRIQWREDHGADVDDFAAGKFVVRHLRRRRTIDQLKL